MLNDANRASPRPPARSVPLQSRCGPGQPRLTPPGATGKPHPATQAAGPATPHRSAHGPGHAPGPHQHGHDTHGDPAHPASRSSHPRTADHGTSREVPRAKGVAAQPGGPHQPGPHRHLYPARQPATTPSPGQAPATHRKTLT